MAGDAGGAGARPDAERVALISLIAAMALAAAKLVVGALTGSLAVLSEGLHSALDAGATALTFVAVRVASKPPDPEHPYGHGRAENLAALAEAALLVFLGGYVAVNAVLKLLHGTELHPPWYAVALMVASIGVDAWRARMLRTAARRHASAALEADAANFTADLLGSAAVLCGLLLARAGFPEADAAAALAVVALVVAMGVRIGKGSVEVLMDRTPRGIGERLASVAQEVEGVVGVEGIRARRSGPHTLAEVTVSVGRTHSVERSHEIARDVQQALARAVPGTSAAVRVRPSESGEDVVLRTFAAANRVGLAEQIHNVLAIETPSGLWLTLHAKVPPETRLADAHHISDILERELRREISALERVEIHLEPRDPQAVPGEVVDPGPEFTRRIRELAEGRGPIVHCHEVAVSAVAGGRHVVLHCDAAPGEKIAAIHRASIGLEEDIHRLFPDVLTVTVHFEPVATSQQTTGDEVEGGA